MSDDRTYQIGPVGFLGGPMEDPSDSASRLSDQLAIFRRPAHADDALPADVARKVATFVRVSRRYRPGLGEPQPAASRRAIDQAGPHDTPLYVVPTDTGSVCYGFATSIDCITSLLQNTIGWNMTYWPNRDGTTDLFVHGIVSDDVTDVRVFFCHGRGSNHDRRDGGGQCVRCSSEQHDD